MSIALLNWIAASGYLPWAKCLCPLAKNFCLRTCGSREHPANAAKSARVRISGKDGERFIKKLLKQMARRGIRAMAEPHSRFVVPQSILAYRIASRSYSGHLDGEGAAERRPLRVNRGRIRQPRV